jgi:hypothetical protein
MEVLPVRAALPAALKFRRRDHAAWHQQRQLQQRGFNFSAKRNGVWYAHSRLVMAGLALARA